MMMKMMVPGKLKKYIFYLFLLKNWRPISLLKTDMEIISKVLSTRIKNVLPFLISSNQTAYVKTRLISGSMLKLGL